MTNPPTKLTPGTYKLVGDLPPLRADKRKTGDWRYLPIQTGTLFFYKEVRDVHEGIEFVSQHLYPVGRYDTEGVVPHESMQTRDLEESLIALPDTATSYLYREHSKTKANAVLDHLIAAGKLTLEDVKNAAKECI